MHVEIPADRPLVEIPLDDGTVAALSPLVPEDRTYLIEGLQEMSLESRFSRFGQGRHQLTQAEWDYLTHVDQRHHVAWVAMVDGSGAGVGRYIITGDGTCAEVAVTVVDRFQGRGVGTALFLGLLAVARADGVDELCFEVLPSNERVLDFLTVVSASVRYTGDLLEARLRPEEIKHIPVEREFVEAMHRFRETA